MTSDMQKRLSLAKKQGTIKRVHVDQHAIRHNINAKPEDHIPTITIQTSAGSIKCWDVSILGQSKVVSSAGKPLSCGARVWVETTAPLEPKLNRSEQ